MLWQYISVPRPEYLIIFNLTCDIELAINNPGHVVAKPIAAKELAFKAFTLPIPLAVPVDYHDYHDYFRGGADIFGNHDFSNKNLSICLF